LGLGLLFAGLAVAAKVITGGSKIETLADVHTALRAHSNVALISLLYSVVFFIRDGFGQGRGLAKRHLGLRVIDLETHAGCGYVKSMLRQATIYLPGINLLDVGCSLFDGRGQRLVDKLLGTVVIDETQRPLSRADRTFLWVLAVLFVLWMMILVWLFAGSGKP
jgi:hypothetical protein